MGESEEKAVLRMQKSEEEEKGEKTNQKELTKSSSGFTKQSAAWRASVDLYNLVVDEALTPEKARDLIEKGANVNVRRGKLVSLL